MKLYPSRLYSAKPSAGEGGQPMVEMNTTPLIDVMLVLLVMLIITIPMQLHSVPLDMSSKSSNAAPPIVKLQIDAQGFVRWNGELVSDLKLLDEKLRSTASFPQQPEIHILPEPSTAYALVVALTAQAQQAGLRQVGIAQ